MTHGRIKDGHLLVFWSTGCLHPHKDTGTIDFRPQAVACARTLFIKRITVFAMVVARYTDTPGESYCATKAHAKQAMLDSASNPQIKRVEKSWG